MTSSRLPSRRLMAASAALAMLAACNQEPESAPQYEADVTVPSGSELIVTEQDPNAVPVDTPDSPMTPVPDTDAASMGTAAAPTASPQATASPGM